MRVCLGRTTRFRRCKRQIAQGMFCKDHKWQWAKALPVVFSLLVGVLGLLAAWKAFVEPAISVAPTWIAASRLAGEGQVSGFTVTNNSHKTLYQVQVIMEAEKPEISFDHIDIRPVLEPSHAFGTKLGNIEIDKRVVGFSGRTDSGHDFAGFLVYSLEPGKSVLFSLRAKRSIRRGIDGHISFKIAGFLEEPGRMIDLGGYPKPAK